MKLTDIFWHSFSVQLKQKRAKQWLNALIIHFQAKSPLFPKPNFLWLSHGGKKDERLKFLDPEMKAASNRLELLETINEMHADGISSLNQEVDLLKSRQQQQSSSTVFSSVNNSSSSSSRTTTMHVQSVVQQASYSSTSSSSSSSSAMTSSRKRFGQQQQQQHIIIYGEDGSSRGGYDEQYGGESDGHNMPVQYQQPAYHHHPSSPRPGYQQRSSFQIGHRKFDGAHSIGTLGLCFVFCFFSKKNMIDRSSKERSREARAAVSIQADNSLECLFV